MVESTLLTIGEVARRAGVATSALRFYEERGLIESERTEGNQRRYSRSVLRRVAIIKAAQAIGISLAEVQAALQSLPDLRTPNRRDWNTLSQAWRAELDERIRSLERLRDDLSDCIGCGCLSLKTCALFNPGDKAGERGPGPRFLLGEEPAGS